jgi:1-acyl-sn-glycerol-3-phosphate acyltransferase
MSADGAAARPGRVRAYAIMYSSLLVFALICLTWTVVALPLYLLLPQGRGTRIGRLGIQRGFRIFAGWATAVGAYRLDLRAIDTLVGGQALVLAPNHPSVIDAILMVTRHPNMVCIMKASLMNNVLLGAGARLAGYIRNHPPRRMVREAVAALEQGAVLLLFPEATRTTQAPVNPFIGSAGLIAKAARVPVQTLIVETDSPYFSKGWSPFRLPQFPITFRVRLGRRFEAPADARAFDHMLEEYFRGELAGALQSTWLGRGGLSPRAG